MPKIKAGLGLKIPLVIALSVIFLTTVGTISGYNSLSRMINVTTGENFGKIATVMASSVSAIIDEEMRKALSAAHGDTEINTAIKNDKAYLGDITPGESGDTWYIPFIVPVKDASGSVIGTHKSLVDISVLFKPLEDFKVGRTGNALLVDSRGYLVYYPQTKPFANKFCDYKELQKALEDRSKGLILHTVYLHTPDAFTATAEVSNQLLIEKGIGLHVFIVQDAGEVFEPLGAFIGRMVLFAILIIIAMSIFAAFIFGWAFTRPMRELQEGFEHLAKGDLDYKVEIKTGDELEGLAASYNAMREGLKKVTTSITSLEKEAQARQKAEYRASAISADFTSETAHLSEEIDSIRNELRSIIEQPSVRLGDKQQQKKATDALDAHIAKLARGVNELADVAAIERGRIELNMTSFDFREMIKDAVFTWEPKIREKGLDLKLDMSANKIIIPADEARLKQVFHYIIEGAIKFTERGYIEISVKELKNDVECSVADTGVSITRDALPGVFERDEYPSGIPGRNARGGGLKLFIAKGIIEAHNGKITVESELNKKTKFTFILPKNASRQ